MPLNRATFFKLLVNILEQILVRRVVQRCFKTVLHKDYAKLTGNNLAISYCKTPPSGYFCLVKKFFLPVNFHRFFQQQYLQYFSDISMFLHFYIITDCSRLLALELLFIEVSVKSVILFVYCLYSSL